MRIGITKRAKRFIAWAVVTLITLFTIDYWTYPLLSFAPPSPANKSTNGIWLRYTYYFGQHSDAEIATKAKALVENGIRYAYFHVRDAKPDGHLRYDHVANAKHLNVVVANAAPSLKRIAWFYVGNKQGRRAVDLSKPETRRTLLSEASRLVRAGFQGIQWDYEICPDGDPSFLKLLDETRAALPSIWIGVAAPSHYSWPLSTFGWSERYMHDVALRSNQIAVMIYDTGLYHPRAYARHAAAQPNALRSALAGTSCTYVLGLPTYDEGLPSHNPRAENLRNAILAIRRTTSREDTAFDGVALFADYTTDVSEWTTFHEFWLSPSR